MIVAWQFIAREWFSKATPSRRDGVTMSTNRRFGSPTVKLWKHDHTVSRGRGFSLAHSLAINCQATIIASLQDKTGYRLWLKPCAMLYNPPGGG
jgi:hypothetical protein